MQEPERLHDLRQFLSTPSARRATSGRYEFRHSRNISIHALREEGDLGLFSKLFQSLVFLSTPSARRATSPLISLGSHF